MYYLYAYLYIYIFMFQNGDTALHIAAAMGRRKLTKILIESGCDIQAKNKQGETSLDISRDASPINQSIHYNWS